MHWGGGVTGRILVFRLCETESELCLFSKNLSMLVYVKPQCMKKVSVETLLKRPRPALQRTAEWSSINSGVILDGLGAVIEVGAGPTQMVVTVTMVKGIRRKGCTCRRVRIQHGRAWGAWQSHFKREIVFRREKEVISKMKWKGYLTFKRENCL